MVNHDGLIISNYEINEERVKHFNLLKNKTILIHIN